MKAYETKKKLALSLAVAMIASSAPVLAFADTAIVAEAEVEMTVEEIIEAVVAAINDPFLAAGLARIEAAEAAVATLPDGATKTALTETLQTAQKMYQGLEQINQIWVVLGAAGWQTNFGGAVAELEAIIASLDEVYPDGSDFLNNFKTAVTETGLTYEAFEAMDIAAVNPTPANIAAAKEAVSKIMNPVAKANAELRIETEIENQELKVLSVSAITDAETGLTTVTAEVVNFEEEDTATITLTPDAWYELEDVVVEDVEIDEDGNVEFTFENVLPVGTHSVVVTVGEVDSEAVEFTIAPTAAQISAAIAQVNSATPANIIKRLQDPALGLTGIEEDNAAAYVTEIAGSLTNTVARIQAAVDRVNVAEADTVQGFIDDLNAALNTADMLTALGALNIDNVLAGNVFDVEYFDAIEANSTTTVAEIQAVIDAVNLAEVEALVAEAEEKLTQATHDAVTVPMLALFEEEVADGFTDRLAAVQEIINVNAAIAAVNAATDADELETALELAALDLDNLDMANNKAAYFTAFDALTIPGADEFETIAEIQAFVDAVNLEEAIAAVNGAGSVAALLTALESDVLDLDDVVARNQKVYFAMFGDMDIPGDDDFETVADIQAFVNDANATPVGMVNLANTTAKARAAIESAELDLDLEVYNELTSLQKNLVAQRFRDITAANGFETAAEVQTKLDEEVADILGL